MKNVLVVEDQEASRLLLRHFLQKHFQFTVYEAENGLEGINLFEEKKPDLVILDIMMPVMNGIEFLEALREKSPTPEVPVIVLTGVGDRNMVAQVVELGVKDYILKPLKKNDIVGRIEKMQLNKTAASRIMGENKPELHDTIQLRKAIFLSPHQSELDLFDKLFNGMFEYYSLSDPSRAITVYAEEKPDVFILSKDVENANLFLKRLFGIDDSHNPEIFLITEGETKLHNLNNVFSGKLNMTSDRALALRQFNKLVFKQNSLISLLRIYIRKLRGMVSDSIIQSLGMTTLSEVREISDGLITLKGDYLDFIAETYEESERQKIEIHLFGMEEDFGSLLSFEKKSKVLTKGNTDRLKDYMAAILNRMRAELKTRGINTLVTITRGLKMPESKKYDNIELSYTFECETGERFSAIVLLSPAKTRP